MVLKDTESTDWKKQRIIFKEALLSDEPVLIDCRVMQKENVYPMVAPGKGLHEMIGVSANETGYYRNSYQ